VDSHDASAPLLAVDLRICDCNEHGECDFDSLQLNQTARESFMIVQCNCTLGWEGIIINPIKP